MTDINEITDDISDDLDHERMPNVMRAQQPQPKHYHDSAADYTERTGRYLNLSERMQERSLHDQRSNSSKLEF
jgi:hypothetical protein